MSDKYLDPQEVWSAGLVFEINRRVLHPLGLALAVKDEDGKIVRIVGILDRREEPEGIIFNEESFKGGTERFAKYLAERGTEALSTREKALGFLIQTNPEGAAAPPAEG